MGSQFLKTVFDALLAMASCDGHLHEDEVEVLELFKSEFSKLSCETITKFSLMNL